MTTAIAVYTSDGCVGRCDAKCHNATSPECDCICGGRLHGTGAQAIKLQTDWIDPDGELRRRFAELHGHDPHDLRLEFGQQELFPATNATEHHTTDAATHELDRAAAPRSPDMLPERQPSAPPRPSTEASSRPALPASSAPSPRRSNPVLGR